MISFFLENAGDIISTVFGLLIAVVGAVVTFITKSRNKGKSWKEIFKSILTGKNQEFEEVKKTLQKQIQELKEKLSTEKNKNESTAVQVKQIQKLKEEILEEKNKNQAIASQVMLLKQELEKKDEKKSER